MQRNSFFLTKVEAFVMLHGNIKMATMTCASRKLERIETFFCDIEKEKTPQANSEI